MEKLTTLTGVGVPLRRSNVDTDQIIPAVFLKRVTKSGFDDALFYAWRRDPNFVLNKPEYAGKGQILVAGPEFGIGSSREHAVWALHDYGFRVVIAPSFADRTRPRDDRVFGDPHCHLRRRDPAVRGQRLRALALDERLRRYRPDAPA